MHGLLGKRKAVLCRSQLRNQPAQARHYVADWLLLGPVSAPMDTSPSVVDAAAAAAAAAPGAGAGADAAAVSVPVAVVSTSALASSWLLSSAYTFVSCWTSPLWPYQSAISSALCLS